MPGFASMLRRTARPLLERVRIALGSDLPDDEAAAQKVLIQQYRALRHGGGPLPALADVGFRKYSQFEEDGILLYLFALIGTTDRRCVEICAGTGRQSNTANLIINHGWWGYLFDGDEQNVRSGRRFYARHRDTFLHPPAYTQAWITAENVNELLETAGVTGEIDLLSLDIDGMDYWVWRAVRAIEPRVVVCEVHNVVPAERAVTVPYDPAFTFTSPDYRGASLAAMCKLGRAKGYRLIGTHRFGFNAFFVRNGIGEDLLPEVAAARCLADPYSERARRERWPRVCDRAWEEV